MSDGRKRLSGAAKRKRELRAAYSPNPKQALLNFEAVDTPGESSAEDGGCAGAGCEEVTFLLDGQATNEPITTVSTSQTDVKVHISEEDYKTDLTVVNQLVAEFNPSILDDPGLWMDVNSDMRDFLVLNGPRQVKVFSFPKDSVKRSFHRMYYWRDLPNGDKLERPWLMYSKTQNAAYCFCCKLFQPNTLFALCSNGTKDWRNLARNLASHEKTPYHQRAFCSWKELEVRLKLKVNIDDKDQEKIASETHHWQNVMKRLVGIVQVLASQNLSLYGTSDQLFVPDNGNFLKIVELMGEFDSVLKEHLRRVTTKEIHSHYLGKTTQDEIIQLLATEVKQKILSLLRSAKYYSIILDCTVGNNHIEQVVLMVRFVTAIEASANVPAVVNVREHFLEFIDVDDTKGSSMAKVLLKRLEEMGIAIVDMRGQSYDNEANMKGKNSGVQTLLQELNPRVFFVPCSSHSLKLIVSDAASNFSEAVEFFNIVQSIYVFFSASAHRWEVLKQYLGTFTLTPKSVSASRWESCVEAVEVIRQQSGEICDAINAVIEDSALTRAAHSKTQIEGERVARNICNFKFLCGLVLWHDILLEINIVSEKLQEADLDITGVVKQLDKTKSYLQCYWSDEGFENVLKSAQKLAEEFDIDADFPPVQEVRSRHITNFHYEARDLITDPKQHFRVKFFNQVLACAIQSVEECFLQLREHSIIFGMLYDIKNLNEIAAEDIRRQCGALEKVLTHGKLRDIDGNDLHDELKALSKYVPVGSTPKGVLEYICAKKMITLFPNTFIALRILLTLPLTIANAGPGSSKLKLIKTHLHSTMVQDRIEGLATVAIEQELAQTIDLKEAVHVFASKKAQRSPLC
ncbi:zinc finger MYM-type protein 1-like [Sceloporus undulatus]|uniref:zinc finger MYM-type protein 1-like n=1 Tax=Sceloporus undulatus TaxID=8520 RepID=UPI001C4CF113|nr:zinc finger MYM-type protein 1-like [Sceloporus undulatus]XP_042320470.1 zinc finger MYM-type protein 1-like [Sceloporus undulatus]XP_042320471.1 zinc finger MYM-type protein 1-like [Sceloporus undulatus]XP_042320472.1 zinc finger MYM-type protein 1-like [Sceloporus undulatus]XP_042320473.1 zinc finger MYM-type protein 1-like [Sceloporus undulatus]XP_042320474.1 zinc finger MYM-type protein 1-like [Sceloporus undulatus]